MLELQKECTMNTKLITTALMALGLSFASQASAQAVTTGTVNLTGSVGVACRVVAGGTLNGNAFAGTVAFGELADSAGALAPIGPASVGGAGSSTPFQINCTGSKVNAAISKTLFQATAATGVAPAGYANKIDYVASAAISLADNSTFTVDTDAATAAPASGQSATRLKVASGNVVITVSNFVAKPDDGPTAPATALLMADTLYSGTVTLTLTPTT
jgi:hypothetical protein